MTREYLRNQLEEHNVPMHLREGLERYIIDHVRTGSFLYAVLCNDLEGAVRRADANSFMGLPRLMEFLIAVAPGACWRKVEFVEEWISRRAKGASGAKDQIQRSQHQP